MDSDNCLCPDGRHPTYMLTRYHLDTREARMQCTACTHSYLRPMSDAERFELRGVVKIVVDAANRAAPGRTGGHAYKYHV